LQRLGPVIRPGRTGRRLIVFAQATAVARRRAEPHGQYKLAQKSC